MPGTFRARRYKSIVGVWSVSMCLQMVGKIQDRRRHVASAFSLIQPNLYMFAVGPPRSEITPVKPGTLSRMASISFTIESSERL